MKRLYPNLFIIVFSLFASVSLAQEKKPLSTLIYSLPQSSGDQTLTSKWDLWIDGPHLRGVNINQRRVYPDVDGTEFFGPGPLGAPFQQSDFDRLAALGCNYVNISHSGLYTIAPPYRLDADVQDNLDRLLGMIEKADMFAVISFRSGPGRSEFALYYWDTLDKKYFNDSVWKDSATQEAWVSMWRATAERYRNNPIVVGYDLMVEPNSNDTGSDYFNDLLEIWEPDEFYQQYRNTSYDWNQLYPRIIKAIREIDADTPILVGGNGYSGIHWLPYLVPVDDPKTVYAVHQYEPQDQYTHKEWNEEDFASATYPGVIDIDEDGIPEEFNRAWLEQFFQTMDAFHDQHHVPIAVNEYGINRWVPNGDRFMDDEMDLFEKSGFNYALWEWVPDWEPLVEIDAMDFLHGPDPNNHTDVQTSALIEVIKNYWSRNVVRPSSFNPTQAGIDEFLLYP